MDDWQDVDKFNEAWERMQGEAGASEVFERLRDLTQNMERAQVGVARAPERERGGGGEREEDVCLALLTGCWCSSWRCSYD